jgi:hypothetical protein
MADNRCQVCLLLSGQKRPRATRAVAAVLSHFALKPSIPRLQIDS